ncbi:hypothetical protein JW887_02500 [Candidatus Dojkabacteria bacterium]|nr:hypothetical protein [Candidatus Dojkabacteria bacterium]
MKKNKNSEIIISSVKFDRSYRSKITPNLVVTRRLTRDGEISSYKSIMNVLKFSVNFKDPGYSEDQIVNLYLPFDKSVKRNYAKKIIRTSKKQKLPLLLMVPGGTIGIKGIPDKKMFATLCSILSEKCIPIMLDFRGFNSKKNVTGYSLKTRENDLRLIFSILRDKKFEKYRKQLFSGYIDNGYYPDFKKIAIIGTSMGGYDVAYVAASLMPDYVILYVPAAYSQKAREINFGKDFSEEIRKPDSWKNSHSFNNFEKYVRRIQKTYNDIRTLVIENKGDTIIPKGLVERYAKDNVIFSRVDGGHRGANSQALGQIYRSLKSI